MCFPTAGRPAKSRPSPREDISANTSMYRLAACKALPVPSRSSKDASVHSRCRGGDPTFSLVPLDHQPAITLGLLTLLFLAGLPLAFAFPVDPAAKHLPAQDGCTAIGACAGLLQGRQLVFILCFLDIFRRRHPDHLPPDTAPDRYSPTARFFL